MNINSLKFAIEFSQATNLRFGLNTEEFQREADRERAQLILAHLKKMNGLGERGRFQSLVALERLSWRSYSPDDPYHGLPSSLVDVIREDGSFDSRYISAVETLLERQLNRSDIEREACQALAWKTMVAEYGGNRNTLKLLGEFEENAAKGIKPLPSLPLLLGWLYLMRFGWLLPCGQNAAGAPSPLFAGA